MKRPYLAQVNQPEHAIGGFGHLEDRPEEAAGETPQTASEVWRASKEYRVRKWIKKYWRIWAENMLARPHAEKISREGKLQTAIFEQSRQDIQPLLKKLKQWGKQDTLTSAEFRERRKNETQLKKEEQQAVDLLDKMVSCCDQKMYREATARYVELQIGNHANGIMGRTRIYKRPRGATYQRVEMMDHMNQDLEIRYMINDETSRKYLQVFKRLMRICETVHPPDEPSMTLA